jgi:L-rhamnose mutarotase
MNPMKFLVLLLASFTLAGCINPRATSSPAMNSATPARAPQRFAWVTGLRPEKAAYYRELHANAWPAVNRQIKASHIQNFSIHEREIEGKLYLFAYLEYTGTDFAADMKKMADDPETRRWWKETDPCQAPLPDAAAAGKIWADTKEVYYLP